MKSYKLLFIIIIALILVNCDKNMVTPSEVGFDTDPIASIVIDAKDLEILKSGTVYKPRNETLPFTTVDEIRLKYFAKGIAKLQKNEISRINLKQEIRKKFDGDFDVLWKTMKPKKANKAFDNGRYLSHLFIPISDLSILDEIEKVQNLNISVPIHFEKWDKENKPLLVAYEPLTVDDNEVDYLIAYDSEGIEYILDAKNPPDYPVMVVGVNERTIQQNETKNNSKITNFATTCDDWYFPQIGNFKLIHDMEPWYKGNPEIYVKCLEVVPNSTIFWTVTNFTGINKEKTYWASSYSWLPKSINVYYHNKERQIRIEVWEDDGPVGDDLLENTWKKTSGSTTYTKLVYNDFPYWANGSRGNANINFGYLNLPDILCLLPAGSSQ